MTRTTRNVRTLLRRSPQCAAGIVGGAALGLGGHGRHGQRLADHRRPPPPAPYGPGYQYYPDDYATPVPTQAPGWNNHHGPNHMN